MNESLFYFVKFIYDNGYDLSLHEGNMTIEVQSPREIEDEINRRLVAPAKVEKIIDIVKL